MWFQSAGALRLCSHLEGSLAVVVFYLFIRPSEQQNPCTAILEGQKERQREGKKKRKKRCYHAAVLMSPSLSGKLGAAVRV